MIERAEHPVGGLGLEIEADPVEVTDCPATGSTPIPWQMIFDATGYQECGPYDHAVMDDESADLREWRILPHDGKQLPAGVFFVFCGATKRLGIVVDATPEEQAEALANACRHWPDRGRVKLLRR